jgi:hypothetical protein
MAIRLSHREQPTPSKSQEKPKGNPARGQAGRFFFHTKKEENGRDWLDQITAGA